MAIPKPTTAIRDSVIEVFLQQNKIRVTSDSTNLNRIPVSGPAIIIANGLFGTADPLLALSAMKKIRKDVVVVTSFDFSSATELDTHVARMNINDSESAIRQKLEALLNQGLLVVLFPARKGTVTKFTANLALDKRWHPKLMRVLYELDYPIAPMFLRTESVVHLLHFSSFSFDKMTALFRNLSQKEKEVSIRVGRLLKPKVKRRFPNPDGFGRFLRAKLYALGSPLDVGSFFFKRKKKKLQSTDELDTIGPSIDASIIANELSELGEQYLILQQAQFSVYLAPTMAIPIAIKEIGRLREITFRQVGEGTGKEKDLDEYDVYYHQLILWDNENQRIVGGYRVGFGQEIMNLHGKRGFYVHSLFKLRKRMKEVLEKSLELGRSYIIPEYQRTRLPLFLLWKGIVTVLQRNTDYQHLIGPVSISNDYSTISRELIVEFIRKHFWNDELASYVKPRKTFKPKIKDVEVGALLQGVADEVKDLDKLIEDIEPQQFRVPVLIKKYLKQNARIIGFNLDPKFADALDGLMVLDLKDIPAETLENLNQDLC